jgi:hypothetical protein
MTTFYKIYSFTELSQKNEKSTVLALDYEGLKYCLIFQRNAFKLDSETGVSHLQFFALSRGWERFTETGYKSLYFNNPKDSIINDNDIKKGFFVALVDSAFSLEETKQKDIFA